LAFILGQACLNEDGNVVAYASRKLKRHEHDYPPHDLELAFLIFAQRFGGVTFMENLLNYFTHHKSLKYLFAQNMLKLRQDDG
jgi:hypothetical protein